MTVSDHDEDKVDPFRRLVDRRVEAEAAGTDPEKARKRALDEASESIGPTAEESANYTFLGTENRYVREEAVSRSSESLHRRCEKIYDGETDPPETSWRGYIATTVRRKGYDVLTEECRHGGKELGSAHVISLDAPDSTGTNKKLN